MQIPKIDLTGDNVKKIRSILKIYCVVLFNEHITKRETEVLAEYLMYGVSKKASQAILLNYGIKENNLRQINTRLQDKGLLKFKEQRQGRELHPDLEALKKLFLEDKEKYLMIQIWT